MSDFIERLEHLQTRALLAAMHSMQNAAQRWTDRREKGLTDTEVLNAFNHEAGDGYAGGSTDHGMYECRPGKFAWENGGGGRYKLEGQPLIRELRVALQIPKPVDHSQPTLF